MSQENVDVVVGQFANTNARDFAAVMDAYAEDVSLVVHGELAVITGSWKTGKAAVGEWFGEWFRHFASDYRFEIQEARDFGDRVFVVASHSGHGRSSGAPVEGENAYVYTVDEGKIARVEVWADRADALEAAGLSESAMSDENVEVVQRLLGTFQAGLVRSGGWDAAAAEFFDTQAITPEVEWIPARELPGPRSYLGRDGFVEFMRTWTEDFEDWSFEVERLIGAPDDRVVALVHQSGTGKGSGVPVELHFGQVFDLEDGRVIRVRLYLTPTEALQAAGLAT